MDYQQPGACSPPDINRSMPDEIESIAPFFSIIVLNWNGQRFLRRCLDAVAAQTYQDFEVIVLDNASTDQSQEGIEVGWPGFQPVLFKENLGFSRANNIGAQIARGKWLAFLNNDAFPDQDWLECLARAIEEYPQAAFFSSRLLYADQPDLVQGSGDVVHISGFAWSRDNNSSLKQSHQVSDEVFSPSAAAALYRRDAFLQVGGFDETFISHLEDVDLGFRLRLYGYRCWYIPEAVVHHIGSASFGRESDRTIYQVQRNVVWAYVKNMPGPLYWRYLPAHLFSNLVFLVYYTLRGQTNPVFRAKWDAIRGLAQAKARRQEIQKSSTVAPEEISRMLDHAWLAPFLLGKTTRKIRKHIGRGQDGEA